MGNYEVWVATFISIIIGIFMFIFFDGFFVFALIGFLATYLTREEDRRPVIGAIASLIFALLFFVYGMIFGPKMPSYIASELRFDIATFTMGLIFMFFLAFCIGWLGGFIASRISRVEKISW